MGWFDAFDHYTVTQDLDFASWDNYVGTGHLDLAATGARHDLTRGFLRRNFWVMETQPGAVNWPPNNNMLDKGEARAMAWNDVGHGADAVLFWQWRSALNGQEQYHGVLVGADGTPVPIYEEARQIGAEFEKAASALAGTAVDSQVAILHDYESRWAINWQRHNSAFDPVDNLVNYYAPLRALARSVDVVADTAPLRRYKLVVAPALNVLTPEAAKNLEAYVRGGGHLVLTQRSAMKDEDNSLYPQRQPGPLAELLGARVEQWYSLDKPVPIDGEWGAGENRTWAEQLSVSSPETKTLMRYGKSNGWLDGQPAAVTRSVGQGSITYIGAGLDGATMKAAAKWMMREAGLNSILSDLPDGVDLAIRSGNGKRVFIFTNYGGSPRTIALPSPMEDVLMGGTVSSVTLQQYGVAVLR
jgi:beta-galactosidase